MQKTPKTWPSPRDSSRKMSMKSSPEQWHSNVKGFERQVYQESELHLYDGKAMENLGIMYVYIYIYNIYYSRRSWKHRETLCFHSTLEHVHLEKSRVTSTLFQSIYFLPLSICCQWVLVRRDENEGGFLWGDLQLSHHGQVPLHTSFDPH